MSSEPTSTTEESHSTSEPVQLKTLKVLISPLLL